MLFFTSDHHFDHANIIKFAGRPFDSLEEMRERLILNWNNDVRPNDTVYCLGDFMFSHANGAKAILSRLNGRKHLILGNHDKGYHINHGWESISEYKRVRWEGEKIVLCHYAMRVWHGSHKGSWMLYGHSHGNLIYDEPYGKSLDVGVDCRDFYPMSFDQIKKIMDKREIKVTDHHGQ